MLGGTTERYPYALEGKFPHILVEIMSLWDGEEMDSYFTGLMVSDRIGRAGFTPDVAADIMHLSLVHAAQATPDKIKDMWEVPAESFVNFTSRKANDLTNAADVSKPELQ